MKKKHGGKRPGAGRPPGRGIFKEPTRPVRIPVSIITDIKNFLEEYRKNRELISPTPLLRTMENPNQVKLPLYLSRISAGFPSPAEDYVEGYLDLNEHLIAHPSATFFLRVDGDSMTGAGIYHGDILIVDRSIEAKNGKIVVAALNGELTVKRLEYKDGIPMLRPENPNYPTILIEEAMDFFVWGVVTSVIHQV